MFRLLFLFWFWFYFSLNFIARRVSEQSWASVSVANLLSIASVAWTRSRISDGKPVSDDASGWPCLCAYPHRIVSLPCLSVCPCLGGAPPSFPTASAHGSSHSLPVIQSQAGVYTFIISFIIDLSIYLFIYLSIYISIYLYIYSSFFEQRFWSDTSYSINPLITYPAICLY